MSLSNKVTQGVPFKFGNKMKIPDMSFAGKLNSVKKHFTNLQNTHTEDKTKHSDLEKHTHRLQNTHHFN
jgi:hypothetical protein